MQRKFVLLGQPGASVAAVIVEAQKFAFVYRTVLPPASHGTHQVMQRRDCSGSPIDRVHHVPHNSCPLAHLSEAMQTMQVLDLGLVESDSVVGAALLEEGSGSTQLIILTTRQLRKYRL